MDIDILIDILKNKSRDFILNYIDPSDIKKSIILNQDDCENQMLDLIACVVKNFKTISKNIGISGDIYSIITIEDDTNIKTSTDYIIEHTYLKKCIPDFYNIKILENQQSTICALS